MKGATTCLGLLALLLFCPGGAMALLTAHSDYNGCNTCHALHGSPSGGYLLDAINTEATCLGCHGPFSPWKSAEIHDPSAQGMGNVGYITCRECHDAHDNRGSNIKMVGYGWDPELDPSKSVTFAAPTIREELPTSDINNPTYKTVVFAVRPDDFNRGASNSGPCQVCHKAGPAAGASTDLADHEWGDCVLCHAHSDGFKKRQCVECHDVNATLSASAPKVLDKAAATTATVGGHLKKAVADNVVGLTDLQWTVQCIQCHTGHSGDVMIPNKDTVGINYLKTGGVGLGGLATDPNLTTEAEICWGCHAGQGVSEWEQNTDTNAAASNYDFGNIYADSGTTTLTQNWIGAWWKSGTVKFGYKTGQIQSTHSVDDSVTGPGVDTAELIRCSYCHDVHDTYGRDGKPYLRGTWMGSPYREDGAPQAGDTWSTNGNFGAVPRGGTQATGLGGYQIDQNNGNPTTGGNPAHASTVSTAWALTNSAGLCVLCHGDDVDNMNKFGNPADAWVGTNGHSNAAIDGTGSNAADIFRMSIRNPNGAPLYTANGSDRGYPRLAYGNAGVFNDSGPSGDNTNDYWGYGFRSQNIGGFQLNPRVTAARPYAYRAYNWGASIDDVLDTGYHKFPCSKCHNPHASRLPRLLISNCLDTKHNTWDDQGTVSTLGTDMGYSPENRGVTFAMATSAQNCHRLADKSNYTNATGDGWNRVSPW